VARPDARYTAPYDVVLDKNGEVWGAGMEATGLSDGSEDGQITSTCCPGRRTFAECSWTTRRPGDVLGGNNESASISSWSVPLETKNYQEVIDLPRIELTRR